MKRLILTGLLFCATLSFAGTEYDLTKGVTFTGRTSITAALLDQGLDQATIKAGKGIIIASLTQPDVGSNLRFTNFLWMDLNYSPPYIKQWVGGNTTDYTNATNWALFVVPNLSITSNKIATNQIMSWHIATNALDQGYMFGPNVIRGSNIVDGTIKSNDIALYTIAGTNIAIGTILGTNIGWHTVNASNLVWPIITNTAMVDPAVILDSINSALTNALYTNTLNGSNITAGTIEVSKLAQQIQTTNIAHGAIVSSNIAAGTIQSSNLADNLILTNHISTYGNTLMPFRSLGYTYFTNNGTGTLYPAVTGSKNISYFSNAAGNSVMYFTAPVRTTNYVVMQIYFNGTKVATTFPDLEERYTDRIVLDTAPSAFTINCKLMVFEVYDF